MKKLFFQHPKALVDKGAKIGAGTRVWAFAHVQPGAQIGCDCNIGEQCYIERGAVVGDRSTIKNGVAVWDGVTIENDVFVGPYATFTNDLYPRSKKKDWRLEKTKVGHGATIGANATILAGISIGSYALIAAGALVTKSVPPHALVLGNPGKVVGRVCFCGHVLKRKGKAQACPNCKPPHHFGR